MEFSLPPDAKLYDSESKGPLLFRLHESKTEPSGDLRSKWVLSGGSTLPSRPTAADLRQPQCDPLVHIGEWGGTNSSWISTTTDFAYIPYEADRRTTRNCEPSPTVNGFLADCSTSSFNSAVHLRHRCITPSHEESVYTGHRRPTPVLEQRTR